MKSFNWKLVLPHLMAIGIFLAVALIFCHPALESNVVIVQSDMTNTQGMTHQSFEYQQLHGHFPLWATNMFCGMPAFQTIFGGPFNPIGIIDQIFQLWLPKPINYFFLLCVGFYILTVCFRIRSWAGIIASLAYAYCTYNPIIAAVGHQTKILAMGYAPPLLGAVVLIFRKKYAIGFILTALFAALQLQQNHTQISYYLFIVIAIMGIAYLVQWIKNKEFKHTAIAITLSIVAAAIGVMVNAVTLLPVYDYANETKRGGQLVMDNKFDHKENVIKDNKTKGMSKEYAFQWSYGKAETMTLMFPGMMGYGSHGAERDGDVRLFPMLTEKSHVAEYLTEKMGASEEEAANYAMQMSDHLYWGDQPFTSGPVYVGAILCFLFVFGMFYLEGKHKWWILCAAVLGTLLALGKNLPGFNNFLFDHLPMYNKFRVPTMALFIPQLVVPLLAALALHKLSDNQNETAWKKLKPAVLTTAGIFAIAAVMYFTFDFSRENKERTSAFNLAFANPQSQTDLQTKMDDINRKYVPYTDNRLYENFALQSKGDMQFAKGMLAALRKDRASLFGKDILRSLAFVAIAVVCIGLFIRKKIPATVLFAGIGIATMIDLLTIDFHYLNRTNFISKDEYETDQFPLTAADQQILKDTDPNYRVFNYAGGDPFQESRTSYYHKSIGGYHPAKLGIYDDLVAYQLSQKINESVLNMLNAKYVIQGNPQTKQPMVFPNPGALGNCWFVGAVQYVNGPVEEMKALDNFNPKDTAIIDVKYKEDLKTITPSDSLSSIKQTAFDNDAIQYQSNTTTPKLAIFSEIFYKDWHAYIDGTPAKIVKANYVLRGLVVPAGKHTIDFKFEPAVYKTGYMLTSISSWFLFALLILYILKELFIRKKSNS